MQNVFDTVLSSSDLSIDRVLSAGLPVALIFYERELPADLRRSLDDLAHRHAGKALIVTLARTDAPQAAARFNVHQFPTLVTVRDGKPLTTTGGVSSSELTSHISYLLGQGPLPASRAAAPNSNPKQQALSAPVSVSERDFDRQVLQSDRPVLVDFWATWCAPCRMVAPTLEKLAREQSSLKIAKVDVDQNPGLANRYQTMSIPTMIVFQGGREVDRWVGALPEPALRSKVSRWIQS